MCGIGPPAPVPPLPVQQLRHIIPGPRLSRALNFELKLLRPLTPRCSYHSYKYEEGMCRRSLLFVWYIAICIVICGRKNHHTELSDLEALLRSIHGQIDYSPIRILLERMSKIQRIVHLYNLEDLLPGHWPVESQFAGSTVTHHIPKPLSNFTLTIPSEAGLYHGMSFWDIWLLDGNALNFLRSKLKTILAKQFEGPKKSKGVEAFGKVKTTAR